MFVGAFWYGTGAAAVLSMCSAAIGVLIPRSDIMLRIQMVCVAVTAAAMYSASHVLWPRWDVVWPASV